MRSTRLSNACLAFGLALSLLTVRADLGGIPNNIQLALDRLTGRLITPVLMGTGTQQTVNFTLSSGMRYTSVASPQCSGCTHGFDPSRSTSLQPVSGNGTSHYGPLDLSGGLVREDCALVKTSGDMWAWKNQTLVLSRGASSLFSDTIGGVIGLGTTSPEGGAVLDTVLGKWLNTHPANSTFEIGFAINDISSTVAKIIDAALEEDTGAGRLHMAATNSSYFNSSQLTWSPARAAVIGTTDEPSDGAPPGFPSDFVFELQAWKLDGPGGLTISSAAAAQAIFEPLFPSIIFPGRFAASVYAGVSGAQEVSGSDPRQWTLPCETTGLVWTAVYNNLEIPATNLIQRTSTGACVGAIQGWKSEAITSFLLGTPAMANAYIIHQTTRDGKNQVGVAPRSPLLFPRSAKSRRALIGGVVGGVVGGLLLIAIAILIFRKNINRTERIYTAEHAPVTPFMADTGSAPNTATHLLATPGPTTSRSLYSSSQAGHGAPLTATSITSPSSYSGTFASQQAASISHLRDGKGRNLYTSVARPGDAPIAAGEHSPTASSTAVSSVPAVPSRAPMLPPAYE